MRGTIIALAVLLVASTSAYAVAPSLSVVLDDSYLGSGYKSYVVQATGTDWNVLWDFDITGSARAQALGGDVYQVFSGGLQTEWSGNGNSGGAMDSYVMLATHRIPDVWPGGSPTVWPIAAASTQETIAGGLTTEGMGTLVNPFVGGEGDAYCMIADSDYTEGVEYTADLFHLVLPDGAYATVDCTILSTVIDPVTGEWEEGDTEEYNLSVQVNARLDGDVNQDGIVDLSDASLLGQNYAPGVTGKTWVQGDFNGDTIVDLSDASMLGQAYLQEADWYPLPEGAAGGTAPVPEPGTMVMLVLGTLCLAGYRLRK